MDLLFSLSIIQEKDKKNVIENINILMKHNTFANEEDKPAKDDVDELLETDTEENQSSDNEEINIEEPVVEPEVPTPDAESHSDQDDLSSGIIELKPTIMELKQVRVELQNTSLETISRLKRKWKKSGNRRDTSVEKEDNSSGSTRRRVVKCGQCQTLIPRSQLKTHKAEKHGKNKEQLPATAVENEREHEVTSGETDKEAEKEVECHLCDDKFLMSEINSHLKTIHNTDVDYEAIMEQFNSMESAPEQRTPKRFKREKSPEPPSQAVEEPLPLLELEYVPEETPVRRETEKAPKVQKPIGTVNKVLKECDNCHKNIDIEVCSMEEHMRYYHDKTNFKCGLCYQTFGEQTELEAHIKDQHRHEKDLLNKRLEPDFGIDECKVVCPKCPLRFITASSRDLHRSVVHAKRGKRRSTDK